jgi:hypothetical protein
MQALFFVDDRTIARALAAGEIKQTHQAILLVLAPFIGALWGFFVWRHWQYLEIFVYGMLPEVPAYPILGPGLEGFRYGALLVPYLAEIFIVVLEFLLVWVCYRANGGATGRDFVLRFVCLTISATTHVLLPLAALVYFVEFGGFGALSVLDPRPAAAAAAVALFGSYAYIILRVRYTIRLAAVRDGSQLSS